MSVRCAGAIWSSGLGVEKNGPQACVVGTTKITWFVVSCDAPGTWGTEADFCDAMSVAVRTGGFEKVPA